MSDAASNQYPPISDYAFIADGNSAALVSREGSVDWCCIRRMDAGSCFGRLLDRERGGYCQIRPVGEGWSSSRRYLDDTLVLETTFSSGSGEARLVDCFLRAPGDGLRPLRQLLRVVEGVRGKVEFELTVEPRFDYGEVRPQIRQEDVRLYSAIGGDDGLVIYSDAGIGPAGDHNVSATFEVRAEERVRLLIFELAPELVDSATPAVPDDLDERLGETVEGWGKWSSRMTLGGEYAPGVLRSAVVLKGLSSERTGAIAAAATTSLPESFGGSLNWDYRFSWVRDSYFAVRSLAEIGFDAEADAFRRFMQRSSAGSGEEMQIMYGLGGERRLRETELDLEGYGGSRPVRTGNDAYRQIQLDAYGELLELSWRWHERGNSPDDGFWRFLVDLVDVAAERWDEPDQGLWEQRGDPQHFVHSKVMCWAALDRGLRLAEECMRKAPEQRWKKTRDAIREAVESEGYSKKRKTFVQSFGSEALDASLLLIPRVGFVDYNDERMIRTTDAIRQDLDDDGLTKRYLTEGYEEGAFLACSFWLVECLVHQGRITDAREVFDRAMSTGNDLGLFSEEYDTGREMMLGNFPQALTHLSHITAALALHRSPDLS